MCIFICITKGWRGRSRKTININDDNNNNLIIGYSGLCAPSVVVDYRGVKDNNNKNNKNFKDSKDQYVKVLVNDPFNNRDFFLKVTKKQKGDILILSLFVLFLLVLFIVFILYLVRNSLLFLPKGEGLLADIFSLSSASAQSLQYAAILLLVYNNAERQKKNKFLKKIEINLVFIVELIKFAVNVM